MSKVSEDEFFAAIGPQDCHPHILPGHFPYTSVFKSRYGNQEFGRIVGNTTGHGPDEYFLTGVRP